LRCASETYNCKLLLLFLYKDKEFKNDDEPSFDLDIFISGQAINIKAPNINKITSNIWEMIVTWNNPLYIPIPDPIDWIYKALNDNAPE